MATLPRPHNFKRGDRITVTDHHTATGHPHERDYHVTGYEGEYYLLIPAWTSDHAGHAKRLPFYYPHARMSTKAP